MTMNSGVVSGLATVVAQTMDTLQDSLVRAILNGLATTMKIVSVVSALNFGKLARLHQPRKFGARPTRRPEIWLETVLPDSEMMNRPAVKDAWDQFQTIAGLTSTKLDREYR
jgi:hypothetical protein